MSGPPPAPPTELTLQRADSNDQGGCKSRYALASVIFQVLHASTRNNCEIQFVYRENKEDLRFKIFISVLYYFLFNFPFKIENVDEKPDVKIHKDCMKFIDFIFKNNSSLSDYLLTIPYAFSLITIAIGMIKSRRVDPVTTEGTGPCLEYLQLQVNVNSCYQHDPEFGIVYFETLDKFLLALSGHMKDFMSAACSSFFVDSIFISSCTENYEMKKEFLDGLKHVHKEHELIYFKLITFLFSFNTEEQLEYMKVFLEMLKSTNCNGIDATKVIHVFFQTCANPPLCDFVFYLNCIVTQANSSS